MSIGVSTTNKTALQLKIEDQLRQSGQRSPWISIEQFLESASYDPELGYYRRPKDPFGVKGDFYTAEQLQPVFGEVMASYIESVMLAHQAWQPFRVIELGAGRQEMRPYLERYGYCGIDVKTNPKEILDIRVPIHGLVFANEFFDALPIHVLRKSGGEWVEVGVTLGQECLHLADGPNAVGELLAYANQWGADIADGRTLEANLQARRWLDRVNRFMLNGQVVVIDYGYEGPMLGRMNEPTLLTYRRHRSGTNILSHIGEQDITAHVNFSDLRQHATKIGWRLVDSSSLANWILRIWDEKQLSRLWAMADQRWQLQWKHLVFGLGESFRVMVWEKG